MKSAKLAKKLAAGQVYVRTGRSVTGQVALKFRNADLKTKIFTPYPLQDQLNPESYTNLSAIYSSEQLKNSNLEDLVVNNELELRA